MNSDLSFLQSPTYLLRYYDDYAKSIINVNVASFYCRARVDELYLYYNIYRKLICSLRCLPNFGLKIVCLNSSPSSSSTHWLPPLKRGLRLDRSPPRWPDAGWELHMSPKGSEPSSTWGFLREVFPSPSARGIATINSHTIHNLEKTLPALSRIRPIDLCLRGNHSATK